jgi:hypothetical protein
MNAIRKIDDIRGLLNFMPFFIMIESDVTKNRRAFMNRNKGMVHDGLKSTEVFSLGKRKI